MTKTNNLPIKTKKAMKQTMNYLSMATLVVMGAILAGCAKETPAAEKENIVTLSVSVGLPEDESTKALDIDYINKTVVKTFAEGETIAVIYKSGESTLKAVSSPLPAGDYGKSATFEVPLISPNENSPIRIIYPAARAKNVKTSATINSDDETIDYSGLNSQNGTLSTLASKRDLCTFDGALSGIAMPTSASLTNRLAILAYTLFDGKGTTDKADDESITGSITKMTISDGTNDYTITGYDPDGHIYVAIRPTSAANIVITAADASNNYVKSLIGKLNDSKKKVVFAPGNLQATWDGSKWNWAFASNQWDYIGNAAGNTSIIGDGTVSDSDVTVDLFGWSTSANTYGIHNSDEADPYNGPFVDWGNTIGEGWRTLTESEWGRVYTRTSGSTVNGTINARYTFATINTDGTGVNEMILFPDGVIIDSGEATWGTINGHSVWGTKCTSAQWAALAAKGCVFLPAAGGREGAQVLSDSSFGIYWSSSVSNVYGDAAWGISFAEDEDGDFVIAHYYRDIGYSVRLVRDVK
jgi:hypothetical protein